jgi:membrane protease YdiL (CAAX protease family)
VDARSLVLWYVRYVDQLIAAPFWWRFISVVRAAVAEEILFRGFAIERLQELTGSAKFASIFSCVVFAVEHVGFWNWSHLLIAGFAGALLTVLYIWRRNMWAKTSSPTSS